MSRLTSLPDKVIIRVTRYLELRDIIELGKAHKKLCHCIYAQPSVWTKDILFPINDPSITDQFIKQTITKITRNYGILDIRMVNLPLTWFGYFLIFDQFAHSLTSITIQSDHQLFMQLCYHLTRFATDLAILQQDNKIPCTFREYALDQPSSKNMNKLEPIPTTLHYIKLDDPPFERLAHISIVTTTTTTTTTKTAINAEPKDQEIIYRLESLFSFLAGQSIHPTKRSRSPSPRTSTRRHQSSSSFSLPDTS